MPDSGSLPGKRGRRRYPRQPLAATRTAERRSARAGRSWMRSPRRLGLCRSCLRCAVSGGAHSTQLYSPGTSVPLSSPSSSSLQNIGVLKLTGMCRMYVSHLLPGALCSYMSVRISAGQPPDGPPSSSHALVSAPSEDDSKSGAARPFGMESRRSSGIVNSVVSSCGVRQRSLERGCIFISAPQCPAERPRPIPSPQTLPAQRSRRCMTRLAA